MIETAMIVISIIFMLTGLVLGRTARKYKTEGAPRMPSYNPLNWFRVWKITDWLTPKGIRLHYTAVSCIMLGLAIYMLTVGVPSIFK